MNRCLFFLLTAWGALALVAHGEDNLLTNGELSGGSSKGVPGWSYKSSYNPAFKNNWKPNTDGNGGIVSIQIIQADEKGGNEWWWQEVECEPEREYQLTVEARSVGSEHMAEVGLELIGGTKNFEYRRLVIIADTQSKAPRQYTTPEWKEFTRKFTIPAGVTKLRLRLGMMGRDVSEASFRQIRLEKH